MILYINENEVRYIDNTISKGYGSKQTKKIYIKESQLPLLKENASSVLYHFTDFETFKKIAESDDFKLSKTDEYNNADNEIDSNTVNNEINGKYPYYISFTRSPNSNQGFSQWYMPNSNMSTFGEDDMSYKGIVRIEFDGDKLNHKFKTKPVDFFSRKFQTMKNQDKKNHEDLDKIQFPDNLDNVSSKEVQLTTPNQFNNKQTLTNPNPFFVQNEDRLFSNEPIIENVSKYITRVDIKIYDKHRNNGFYDVFNLVHKTILGQQGKIHLYDEFEGLNKIQKDNDLRIDGDIEGNSTAFKTLGENYRQLEIPFDGNPIKHNYLQFLDYLEEMGRFGELQSSKYNPLKNEDDIINAGRELFYFGWAEESDELDDEEWETFLTALDDKYDTILLATANEEYLDPWNILDYYSDDESEYEYQIIYNGFYEKGKQGLTWLKKSCTWKNGLIYVERAIKIADLLKKKTNYFNQLTDTYSGVGRYWSWRINGADTYWDSCDMEDDENDEYMGEETIIIKGYVDPKSVNWPVSTRLYEYVQEESELRLEYGGEVQISEIITDEGKRLPLSKPLIVNV